MRSDTIKHPAPVRRYIRAAAVDVAIPSEMEPKPSERWLPDIDAELRDEICGCIRIPDTLDGEGRELWHVTFAWPTFSERQDRIKELVSKLTDCWEKCSKLPEQTLAVSASVVDLAAPLKDGQAQMKQITVQRTLKCHAARYGFVGAVADVAVDSVADVEVVKPVEKVVAEVKVI